MLMTMMTWLMADKMAVKGFKRGEATKQLGKTHGNTITCKGLIVQTIEILTR